MRISGLSALISAIIFSMGFISVQGIKVQIEKGKKVEFRVRESEQKVDVMIGGMLITSYYWPENVYKPVLLPIRTLTGTEITRGFPLSPREGERNDHIHQVGSWLNYGNVNGFDFWGNGSTGKKSENGGEIKHLAIEKAIGGIGEGLLSVKCVWQDPSGKELLEEKTEFHFIADDQYYCIDRITTLTAGIQDISMKDSKEGMFAIRVARQLEMPSNEDVRLLDSSGKPGTEVASSNKGVTGNYRSSEGITGEAVWGTRAKWMALYGIIGNEEVSVVICDHPKNPSYPTYWHARGYGLFSANPLGGNDFTKGKEIVNFLIPAGNSVSFRYRTIITSGIHLNDDEINKLAKDFAGRYSLQSLNRWKLEPDGSISRIVKKGEAYTDNIEMSGRFVSVIATYGVDQKGSPVLSRQLVFPMLRTIPNDTHANIIYTFGTDAEPVIKVNNRPANEQVNLFVLSGLLTIESTANNSILIKRELFPSTDKPLAIERFTLKNTSGRDATIDIEDFEKISRSHPEKSVYGVYEMSAKSYGSGIFTLKPNESLSFAVIYSGRKLSEQLPVTDVDKELGKRNDFVNLMFNNLTFLSPDPVLNRMFDFAKVRAMESIYETKGGLVHSPGGASYYAAIWANDQAEYANPFFAYTGYPTAIEAGKVSWSWFAKYMNPEYKPIPSSIIAEGTDFWNGAGDRGDQAMIAYGASRFALALGDRKTAEEVWPLIEWCIEYCKRKINSDGVVTSDSDELEGRFPAGKANLCTSSLFYDALISASYLAKELGKPAKLFTSYTSIAKELRMNIEKHFGAVMDGFETYRYYNGNDVLRSWICIPLTVGIFDRAEGTINALFSPKLWTDQGLLTQAGTKTFWDRSTLYGLRGVFAAGSIDRGLKFFTDYSNRRLLGDHVPYAVEAWPEGNQRHLSAESALYCRVVTEGVFGFRPVGLNAFTISPQLPSSWNEMSLNNIVAFGGKRIDISVLRLGEKIKVDIISNGKNVKSVLVKNGFKIEVKVD